MRSYRHIDTITALFVAVLLISNIAATKILVLGPFTFDGGTILFPLSYIFGDILTEVYGYGRSRKVIWLGFISAAVMAVTAYGFETLGLDRIFAKVKKSNVASARVLDKAGYRRESSDGLEVSADYLLYTVERDDWSSTRTIL